MPIIKIEMFPGRTKEQKRELSRRLTDAFIDVAGGKPEGVHILFTDVPKDEWSVGGELCSDRDEKR
jgi:4-oxalocrotonate tautomerase